MSLIASAPRAVGNGDAGGAFDGFPIWKDVPAGRFATLKEGKAPNGTRWGVFAYRAGAREKPCLLVSRITAFGAYGLSTGCGALVPSGDAESQPVVASMEERQRIGAPAPMAFYGMTFAPGVVRVELSLSASEMVSRRTRKLSRAQSKKTGLSGFRYLALRLEPGGCLNGIRGFDRDGNVVLVASLDECEFG